MSLRIDVDTVSAVLLADGWHTVLEKSFDLDSYEFMHEGRCIHGGGASDVCATGFVFYERRDTDGGTNSGSVYVAGPLTALLAVRYLESD